MVCDKHPDGCGFHIKPGDVIFIDAGQCRYYRGVWYVSCRILDSDGNRTCKVGYTKVLADMMFLIGNRVGITSSVHVRDVDCTEIRNRNKVITKHVKKKKPDETTKSDNNAQKKQTKSDITAQKKYTPGKTLDLCGCVYDYALINLIDGGLPSFVGAGSPHVALPDGGGGEGGGDSDDGDSDDADTVSSVDSEVKKPAAKKNKSSESKKRSSASKSNKSADVDSLGSQERKAKKKKTTQDSKKAGMSKKTPIKKNAGGKKKG
jgi:hypothetical protein